MKHTEKLLKAILPICNVKVGPVSTAKDGVKYRYDYYETKYPSIFNSVVELFAKAAEENGQSRYSTNFMTENMSFNYERPPFKGQPNGKIRFSKLIIID